MKWRRILTYFGLLGVTTILTVVLRRQKPEHLPSDTRFEVERVIEQETILPTNQYRLADSPINNTVTSISTITEGSTANPNPSDGSTREWKKTQTRRLAHLREVCSSRPEYHTNFSDIIANDRTRLWSFIYNDTLKIVYGSLCKVQSTSWKQLFMVLDGAVQRVEDVDLKKWSSLNGNLHYLSRVEDIAGVESRLRDYTKYLIVREPFSRALSGYRNKLARRNAWFEKLVGRKIMAKFRDKPSRRDLLTGIGVTFTEFLKHIAYLDDREIDGHWKPMYRMIYPCDIQYDYIGKQETSDVDIKNILERLNMSSFISSFPKESENPKTTTDTFTSYYEKVDAKLLRDVYWKFLPDIELFGYELPDLIKKKFAGIGFDYASARSNLTYFH